MPDIEVHIDLGGVTHPVGVLRRHPARGGETVTFEYADAWLANDDRFSIDPGLRLGRGVFPPAQRQAIFGAVGDSAPDTWGRRLMQRAERRSAERAGRAVRTLSEADYLLGVSDATRLGALRLRWAGEQEFQAPTRRRAVADRARPATAGHRAPPARRRDGRRSPDDLRPWLFPGRRSP